MEAAFIDSVNKLPANGMRLKKFRQPILDQFGSEKTIKEQFAELLGKYCESGHVSEDSGIVTKIKSFGDKKRKNESDSDTKQKKSKGDGVEGDADNSYTPMQSTILQALNDITDDGIRLKKFRKSVLEKCGGSADDDSMKQEFADALEFVCNNEYAKLENGIVTRVGERKQFAHPPRVLEKVEGDVARKELWKYGEQAWQDGTLDQDYLAHNPDGITRLFCGNLKKDITEEQLHNAIEGITHIKWMTDKVTREFYGSTFIEMRDPRAAAAAVMLDKTKLLGRPMKIYYCPPRPGDIWPPVSSGRGMPGGTSAPRATKDIRPKPPGCRKLFCGNLAYEIDDDTICNFFKECGQLTGLRWLTRKETGEFRGCAFVEFGSTEEADLAITLNGNNLLGRPIRLDWDA